MKNRRTNHNYKRVLSLLLALLMVAMLVSGCGGSTTGQKVKLNPKNPVVISIWHYYNGAIMNAFEAMVVEFNETVGEKLGIIVEGTGMGNVSELEAAVISSANKEVGSLDMPNIFASYADTAYAAEKMGLLANLDDYLTVEEQREYIDSYIAEGKIGMNGELRIFPIAKSTEILMVNETDWLPFAEENSLTYDDLSTMQGIARVSELYYMWTDSRTPDVLNDGKSFFGRDSMANMFIIASKEYGTEIFKVSEGKATINADPKVMRAIWDYYYLPYISGYYSSYGKFRSDDTKVGDILSYIGSTSSAAYFPSEVTTDGIVYPIEAKVLPVPSFEGPNKVLVQQGAGMVVTKGTPQEEYASVVFLQWFTEVQNNIKFSSQSGYMPVKKAAIDYEKITATLAEHNSGLDEITEKTLKTALDEATESEMYTNMAFDGGAAARAVLDHCLQDKAVSDRETIMEMIESGSTRRQAIEAFNTEENFNSWLEEFTQKLSEAAK